MEFHAPTSVRGAADLLARYAELARVLAGGTDLVLDLKVLAGEAADEPPRELQGLLVPVPGMELRDHLAGDHHEGGGEVDGAVPPVVVRLGGGGARVERVGALRAHGDSPR